MADVLDRFVTTVKNACACLSERGYGIPEGGVCRSPAGGSVHYQGCNVSLMFSYDIRDNFCECYVGRVKNGSFVKASRQTLFEYMVEKHNYRRSIPVPASFRNKEFAAVYGFVELIRSVNELVNDKMDPKVP